MRSLSQPSATTTRAVFASLGLALAALNAAACSGTAGGDTGDPHTTPPQDEYGTGERVTALVGDAGWLDKKNAMSVGCSIPADKPALLTGQIIVAVDRFDETGAGQTGNIYVEDVPEDGSDPQPYSGLTIFGAGFSPPDLRVFPGDLVDSFGSFSEFIGPSAGPFGECKTLPEFTGTLTFRFEDAIPQPLTIVKASDADPTAQIRGYANARRWLGMLVRVENPTLGTPACTGCPAKDCTQCPADWVGRYAAPMDVGTVETSDSVGISNELMDVKTAEPSLGPSTKLKSVTGIFTYFYGFKVAPRSEADFEH